VVSRWRLALSWLSLSWERVWPVLTPAELLHDLFGSRALIDLAARKVLSDSEREALHRPRQDDVRSVVWSHHDVPLLDDALRLRDGLGAWAFALDVASEAYEYEAADSIE
jgi:hypothetical protein